MLGRTWDQNRDLVRALEGARSGLEETVRRRTVALEDLNAALKREIDERTSTERALQDSEARVRHAQRLESIGVLAGGIAHDFNNLLAVILGNLELLRDEVTDAPNRALIDAAIGATQKGADLTRYLLRYARRAPLSPEVIDLNAVVRETGNWTARTLPSSIAVETSLLAGLWRAAGIA